MALYKSPGEPMCVAHSHQQLLVTLARPSHERAAAAVAATEMRRHLNEIERSLAAPTTRATVPLRDVFKSYKVAA
jgi:hypothetical protein